MKIELTDNQMTNLNEFLKRVDLKGAEVPAFVEIINALGNSEPNKMELTKEA